MLVAIKNSREKKNKAGTFSASLRGNSQKVRGFVSLTRTRFKHTQDTPCFRKHRPYQRSKRDSLGRNSRSWLSRIEAAGVLVGGVGERAGVGAVFSLAHLE